MNKNELRNAFRIARNLNILLEKRGDKVSWYNDIDQEGKYLRNITSETNAIYKTVRRITANPVALLSTLTDSQKTLIFAIHNKKTGVSKATIDTAETLAVDLGVDNVIFISLDSKVPAKAVLGRFYDRKHRPMLEFFDAIEFFYNPFDNFITKDIRIHKSFSAENPGLSKKNLLKVKSSDIICRYLGASSGDVIRYEMRVFLPTYEISSELIFRVVV